MGPPPRSNATRQGPSCAFAKTTPGPTTPAPTPALQDAQDVNEYNDEENGAPAAAPPGQEKLTIWVPGRYCPCA